MGMEGKVNIKIPQEIKVGGHAFKVVLDNIGEGYGRRADIDYKRLVISIVPDKVYSVKNEGFIHEILHAIDTVYLSRKIDSEDIIEPLAEGLWQVFEQLGIEFDFSGLENTSR